MLKPCWRQNVEQIGHKVVYLQMPDMHVEHDGAMDGNKYRWHGDTVRSHEFRTMTHNLTTPSVHGFVCDPIQN